MDDFREIIDLDHLTSDDTITLARTAAEAIRGLNWTTGCDAGLEQPSACYDIIGALRVAASRLPQLVTQITAWLEQALAAGRLGHDLGDDPAHDIGAVAVFLDDVRGYAAAMTAGLDTAQQYLAAINATPRKEQHP